MIEIQIIDERQAVVRLASEATPLGIRAAAEALAQTGGLDPLRGKLVHLFAPDPAAAVAFVWVAKPWLGRGGLTVNGITVIAMPKSSSKEA